MLNSNNEIWKDIPEFKGRYQASNLGRIRSILTNHGKYQEKLKGYSIRSESCRYYHTQLYIKNVKYHVAVHRAVAKAFIPNPFNKPQVNHIDGNKLNNKVENLEWVTVSENHIHAFNSGLRDKEKQAKKMIGTKWGKTSKYRNVTYDPTRRKWKGTMKHAGKMLPQRRFNTEIEAAEYVNFLIDSHNLDRPKNIII